MSPLSTDPAKRQRQLQNLRPGAGRAGAGNRRALAHGGYATVAVERMAAAEQQVFEALAQDAPLREADGGLPAADTALVRLLAQALCRIEDVGGYLRDHGLLDANGQVRGAVDLERRLRQEAAGYMAELGMGPRARAALGLDLVRTARTLEGEIEAGRGVVRGRLRALDGDEE
ncbi:MAG TPA: hypothetical protein VMD09_12785 [Solirubrobacteraceae bacterium]|nr:hypothetical protein [Solirubrobacteraceae bacterium]